MHIFLLGFVLIFSLVTTPARADDARNPFVTVKLPKSVELKIPRNWSMLSNDDRITLNASVEAMLDLSGHSGTSSALPFAANLNNNERTIALMNVRYYDDVEATQHDLRAYPDEFAQSIDADARAGIDVVARFQGFTIVRWDGTEAADLFGTALLLTGYVRSPIGSNSSNRQVRLARVLDGDHSFTLTVSHDIEAERILGPITDAILTSLRTRWSTPN